MSAPVPPQPGPVPAAGGEVAPASAITPSRAGAPIGRRLFVGLLGAGAGALVLDRFRLRGDDGAATVAEADIASGPATQPVQREALEGQHPNITSEGRFRYYSVGTIPTISESAYRLDVGGPGLDGTLHLRHSDVRSLPNVTVKSTFRCVTGWRVRDCLWRGVRLRDVLAAAHPNRQAKFVTLQSGDGVYTESLSWAQAQSDHAILCWEFDGQPLIREQGWPMRLIHPDLYGYKNAKWVVRIMVGPNRILGFWESHDGWDVDGSVTNPDQTGST